MNLEVLVDRNYAVILNTYPKDSITFIFSLKNSNLIDG